MEIRPRGVPPGRQIITAYGEGGFVIAGRRWNGSVLVFPDRTLAWPVSDPAALAAETLAAVVEARPDVLLLGLGATVASPWPSVRTELARIGLRGEAMTTAAACRTFNILVTEDRQVVAALIAV